MAVMTPSGTAMRAESSVTAREATRSGNMPKSGGEEVGYHSRPKRKSNTDAFVKIGAPSTKRKTRIRKSTRMDTDAAIKKPS